MRTAAGKFIALMSLWFATIPVLAQSIAPGSYEREGGWGTFDVGRANSGGDQPFKIETVGATYHLCNVEGNLRDGRATVVDVPNTPPCIVNFKPFSGGIEIDTDGPQDACRAYCGMRAWFTGKFLQPAPGCSRDQRAQTKQTYKAAYDRRAYTDARSLLAPLLDHCKALLSVVDEGMIRNDLALTQHRLGDNASCRRTLDPLARFAHMSDAYVRERYPLSNVDEYTTLARATRFNFNLCGGPPPKPVAKKG